MRRFTTRPNPDQFDVAETLKLDSSLKLELWRKDDETVWVLTVRDEDGLQAHTAMHDAMAAKLLRYQV